MLLLFLKIYNFKLKKKFNLIIKNFFLDLGMDAPEADAMLTDPIPLANVNATILKKVIMWCQYHKDDPPVSEDPECKDRRTDDIPSWDVEFLKVDQGTLFELILVFLKLTKVVKNNILFLYFRLQIIWMFAVYLTLLVKQ